MSEPQYAEGEAYLVLKGVQDRYSQKWYLRVEKIAKRKPSVESDEVALLLRVKLPAALFEKPTLAATISVEGDVPQMELEAETVSTIENVIRSTTGLDVHLTLVKPE